MLYAPCCYCDSGCEYQNQNYLLTTTECPTEKQTKRKAVSAHDIQRDMEKSGCAFPVMVLDCCRNFTGMRSDTRSTLGGLTKMEPHGSYIALACAANAVSEDGKGRNGTFTAALLKHIDTPGKDIDFILSDVRAEVEAKTKGKQTPFSEHSLKKRPACLC